jgi:hypothetical protein
MSEEKEVVSTDKLNSGVVVTFKNGRSGLYSGELLSEMVTRAEDMRLKADQEELKLPGRV